MPITLAAQSFTESSSRQRDRGEGPRCCGFHEELTAIDKTDRRITFKVPIPATALRSLKGMQTGAHLKITAPFDQPTDLATIVAVESTERHQSTSTSSAPSNGRTETARD